MRGADLSRSARSPIRTGQARSATVGLTLHPAGRFRVAAGGQSSCSPVTDPPCRALRPQRAGRTRPQTQARGDLPLPACGWRAPPLGSCTGVARAGVGAVRPGGGPADQAPIGEPTAPELLVGVDA